MNTNWIALNSIKQLEELSISSTTCSQIVFKHSTRCHISRMGYKELELFTKENNGNYVFYYLDILEYRDDSNEVSKEWKIAHESPQVLIIKNKILFYNTSHEGITNEKIKKQLNN